MKQKKPTIFLAGIIILLAAVLIYIVVELNSDVATAPVVLPDLDRVSTEDVAPEDQTQYAQVTPETVQAVIGAISRPEGYTRSVTVEDFWGDGSSHADQFTIQVSGTSSKITVLADRGNKYILVTDAGTWIWYDDVPDDAYYAPASGLHDGDQWLRTLTYEDFLEMPAEDITAAGYEEHNGVWCVYASYETTSFGYTGTLWISVTDGLLCATEIYDGDTLIYRMTGGAVDTTVPDDSLFIPPYTDNAPESAYLADAQNFAVSSEE